jgi:hypothetical protein
MARMTRKQIYIEPDQNRRLRTLARQRGKTESELIREGVERILSTRGSLDLPLDHQGWEEAVRFMEAWRRKGPVKGKRTWTRDDAHER